jgi:hypothetical protein
MNDHVGIPEMAASSRLWPLVIDLDGTLIKTNSLDETFLDSAAKRHT